jgi:hypothetical protein
MKHNQIFYAVCAVLCMLCHHRAILNYVVHSSLDWGLSYLAEQCVCVCLLQH